MRMIKWTVHTLRNTRLGRLLLISLLFSSVLISVGCAVPAVAIVDSLKEKIYTNQVDSVFVVSLLPDFRQFIETRRVITNEIDLVTPHALAFEKNILAELERRGIRADLYSTSGHMMNRAEYFQKLKQFAPSHLLVVKPKGIVLGSRSKTIFDVQLHDIQNKKPVWRANIEVLISTGNVLNNPLLSVNHAEKLAESIVVRLDQDGLLARRK